MEDNKQNVSIEFTDILEAKLSENYKAPEFKTVKGKDFVPYTDADGKQYPELLISLFNNSSLHNAIMLNKMFLDTGNGFTYDVNGPAAAKTEEFLTEINRYGENANEVLFKLANDYELFGGFSMLVTWSKDWSTVTEVEHIAFDKLRSSVIDDEGRVPGYYYAYDWNTQRPNKIFIPTFNVGTAKENNSAFNQAMAKTDEEALSTIMNNPTTQVLVYKPYRSGSFYYPYPTYVGAINAIKTDIYSNEFGLNSFKNGLSAEYIVTFFGNYDSETKKRMSLNFLKQHANASAKKLPIIAFAKDAESAMKVDQIAGTKDDRRFTSINDNTMLQILSGHRVTSPLLVGIRTSGGLGNTNELEVSAEIFFNTVIKPTQFVLCKAFNKVMMANGMEEVSIDPLQVFTPEGMTPATENIEIEEANTAKTAGTTDTTNENK